MAYATTKRMLADDIVAALRWVQQHYRQQQQQQHQHKIESGSGEEVVLVWHSSGGGLAQLILSEPEVRVKGLALLASVPGFGS
jgi:pimeloyl-ACP methyl ester carboxylesterase